MTVSVHVRWCKAGLRTRACAYALRVAVCAALCTAACRARSSEEATPVPACQEYERAFARCTGIDAAISTQPEALARNDEEREQLTKLCSSNLERLRQNCR
jgi:hypothetical protein